MALKNMIKVGDKVTFGRSGNKKQLGIVVKTNPKTARIRVARVGLFDVTYNLIQKPRSAKKRAPKKPSAGEIQRAKNLARFERAARAREESLGLPPLEPMTQKELDAEAAWERRVLTKAYRSNPGAKRKPVTKNPSYEEWSRIQKGPPKGWSPKNAELFELYDYRKAEGTSASVRKAIQKELERRVSGMSSGLKFDPMTGKPLKENPSSKRMVRGVIYLVPGTRNTVEKVAWGYIVRDSDGNKIGERSTRKLALELGTRTKKNPAEPRLGGRYGHMVSREEDWPAEESMGFAATEPDLYEEEPTGKFTREQTRRNPPKRRRVAKKNPSAAYGRWLEKRTKADLRKLERALVVVAKAPGAAARDAKLKLSAVKKELRRR